MNEARAPLCFVLSAPSGAGKTSLANAVLGRVERLTRTVSWTTRPPRHDESDGIDYTFVDRDAFEQHDADGGFLESAMVHGDRYGTPRSEVDRIMGPADDAIMVIDVQGAAQVRERLADAVTIFVLPPSRTVLEERLEDRDGGDPSHQQTIKRRLAVAAEEIAQYVRYDYVIINDDFEQAARDLQCIVLAERCRRRQRSAAAGEILESFR